jgi:hypothetical protein
MFAPALIGVGRANLDKSLASPCSRCDHSEFIHSERGSEACLFHGCRCQRFLRTEPSTASTAFLSPQQSPS